MNQKNYKAIAEIIKSHKFDLITNSYGKMDLAMIKDLVDYFEKEERELWKGISTYQRKFNRKQFLKMCGVENE